MNNTNWFVRGPDASHSRTVHEQVQALVKANAGTTSTDTAHPIVFTGTVTPNHAGGSVFLQEQRGSSDDWQTLKSGRLDANSNYSIAYRWRRPGERDVRVVFRSDDRNLRGVSDPVTVDIQQAQVPGFTISSSAPITDEGDHGDDLRSAGSGGDDHARAEHGRPAVGPQRPPAPVRGAGGRHDPLRRELLVQPAGRRPTPSTSSRRYGWDIRSRGAPRSFTRACATS